MDPTSSDEPAIARHRTPPKGSFVLQRTPAERLDHALDGLLAVTPARPGPVPGGDQELHRLLVTAGRLQHALAPVPISSRFEARLAHRLGSTGRLPSGRSPWWLHVPGWLVLTGAVSSAAVGLGVTAYAVWRGRGRTLTRRMGVR